MSKLSNKVEATVLSVSSYEAKDKETKEVLMDDNGNVKYKVTFTVKPTNANIEIPNNRITVSLAMLKLIGVDATNERDRNSLQKFAGEKFEFEFFAEGEELSNGGKCEKPYVIVRSVTHQPSIKYSRLILAANAGGVFQLD